MTTKRRSYLADYIRLWRDPFSLFGQGADNTGASVKLWPNGEREIWIQGAGKGFRISASEGPAGLSLRISTFAAAPPITISGNAAGDYEPIKGLPDARHLELCQYNSDAHSQAFKEWYQGRGEHPGPRAKG